jgi:carbon monoxide dehydrogenase subunit G
MPRSTFERILEVSSSADECWQVLLDVPRLTSWISIIEDAKEITFLERYSAVLMDRMGPFKLRSDLDIQIPHYEEGRSIEVRAAGEDRQVGSRLVVEARLSLESTDLGTRIHVQGVYEVTGRVASMGSSTIRKKADKILEQFFSNAVDTLGGT